MFVLKLSNKELMERLETLRGLLKRRELYDHTYIYIYSLPYEYPNQVTLQTTLVLLNSGK